MIKSLIAPACLACLALPFSRAVPAVPATPGVISAPVAAALPGRALTNEASLVGALYSGPTSRLLWLEHAQPSHQAAELLAELSSSEAYGLRPEDYGVAALAVACRDLHDTDRQARCDQLLSTAALRLLSHLHYGRVDPRAAGFELPEPRHDLDLVAAVNALAESAHVADAIAAVEPHFYHYGLLKSALARYRILAADPTLSQLPRPTRPNLRAGDTYEGAPGLRRLLAALGDLPPAPESESAELRLDPLLTRALQRFQTRHGLPADGTLGAATYQALIAPLAQRVRQIALTLERWRWLPPFDSPPIIVNIPQFRLFAFRSTADRAADIMQMAVIVGQTYPRTRTPVFMGQLRTVIFRPYWDVPRSILLHELLPKIQANPDYVHRNSFEIVRGEGDDGRVQETTPATIGALAAGQLRLRQRPGADNALGLVKFLFPNVHNVYLHSTPAHQLFAQSRRTFSHGCIRVSDPVALAAHVLRNAAGNWDAAHIEAAMQGSDARRVELLRPIDVMILYATVQATEAGPVEFFDDIYGHDRRLARLLAG